MMMVHTYYKHVGTENWNEGGKIAEGVVNRRRLTSQTRLSNKTNSGKKGEVVLNELTMNRMTIKNLLLRYQPGEEPNGVSRLENNASIVAACPMTFKKRPFRERYAEQKKI